MIKSIKTYDAYFYAREMKRLFGITEKAIEKIEVIDQDGDAVLINDFFKKGGVLYFSVNEIETVTEEVENLKTGKKEKVTVDKSVTKFYQQKETTISEIDELPEKPSLSRAHYDSKEFTITDFEYEKKPCTDVKNISRIAGIERFFMVDGFFHYAGSGMFFNVSDGRYDKDIMVREKGLYYWSLARSGIEYLVGEGALYK